VGIIAYGSSHFAVVESREQLEKEAGIRTAYMRVRAYPFPDEVAAFMRRYPRVYVVEQNRDAQLKMLLRNDLPVDATNHARSVLHYNGLPIDARSVTDEILIQEGRKTRSADNTVAPAGVAVLRED
jgi:2-oxoglutarate/2-oxoacid ferredoxin oxidoreductase subunit alpha